LVSPEVARAKSLAPVRTFKGSLCLESLDEEALPEFEAKTGVGLGWGAPHWLQLALFRANGRRSAWDIYQWLSVEVSAPDLEKFNHCIVLLARHGFVRLRPVLGETDFLAAFESVGVPHGQTVLVHSSLRDFGYVSGGAATVIAALRKAIGPEGTLAMPALSCSWVGRPPFDRDATPTHTGAIPEAFRQMPGVVRSGHPSHSVAACGPRAEEIVATHDPERPVFAPETPWGKLYDLDAWILMLCRLASNTAMHMGEERNGLLRTDLVAHVVEGGERREVPIVHAPWHASFDRHYELLRERGQLQSAPLGEGTIHLMRFRHAVDAATENVARDPSLAMGGESCQCTFCANIRAYLARTS
jgi:aminoglycoside 3-N-acetyltransferase